MLRQEEEHREADKLARETIEALHQLEGFAYNLKNQISDEDKLGSKISEEDKETLMNAIKETLEWLDSNRQGTKEEFEEKKLELEKVSNPIMTKLYQQYGGAGGGPPPGAGSDEEDIPSHDEL